MPDLGDHGQADHCGQDAEPDRYRQPGAAHYPYPQRDHGGREIDQDHRHSNRNPVHRNEKQQLYSGDAERAVAEQQWEVAPRNLSADGRTSTTTGISRAAERAIRAEVTAAGDQPATITALDSGPELANRTQDVKLQPVARARIDTRAAFPVIATSVASRAST